MLHNKSNLYISVFLLFLSQIGFSQIKAANDIENTVLMHIDSASIAIDEGKMVKSADFLNLAKTSIDSTSSQYILYKYYITLGALTLSRHQISDSQNAYTKALEAARNTQDSAALINVYSGLANSLLIDKKYKKALVYQKQALEMLENDKTSTYYSLLSNMSISYTQAKDFDNALTALLTVKKYFEEQGDIKLLAIIENNLGELYRENFEDFTNAKAHYHKAIQLNISIDNLLQLSYNYHNMSLSCIGLNQVDSAFFYVNKALDIKKELSDLGGLASTNHALGLIYYENKEYDEAINSFQKSLSISQEFGITLGMYYANLGIGDALLAKGNRPQALLYYEKVEEIVKNSESFDMKKEIGNKLFKFYKEGEDFKRALFYSERIKSIEDSLSAIERNEHFEELRVKYETSLAETENTILKEREVAQKKQISLQNLFLIILFIALVFLLILLVFLFRSNLAKRKAKDELERQFAIVKEREAELDLTIALKNKIFSVLGHDLRTPLANVSSLIDSMSQIDLSPEELAFMLKHLKGETNASLKTLENILQWARLQMNENSLTISELDEDGIVIEIIKNFESQTEGKEIEVVYVNNSSSIFCADENQFRSIANNLIGNAIKFSPVKGKVDVSFIEKNGNFIFTVSDQGEGIRPSVIKNLETQKELLSTYGTEGEKGTGIGLRIVKDFIILHKGTLGFSKNEPKGTKVIVTIPKLKVS